MFQYDRVIQMGATLFREDYPGYLLETQAAAEIELPETLHLSDHNPMHGLPRFTTWEILDREIRSLWSLWLTHWSFFDEVVERDFNGPLTVKDTRLVNHHASEMFRIGLVVDQAQRLKALLLQTMEDIFLEDPAKLEFGDSTLMVDFG